MPGTIHFQSAFTSAAATWQSLLSGYLDGLVVARTGGSSCTAGQTVDTIYIDARVEDIDGVGGILGSAGPTELVRDSSNFILSTDGAIRFDSADFAGLFSSGLPESVILQEMAHVMGFGTLWEANGVYIAGTGEFTGANATAAWLSEFGQTGTPDFERGGGSGTANAPWIEVNGGGWLTGIRDSNNRDMRDGLMTGWLNPNSFISNRTVQSFVDIGFVASLAPVPEPASLAMWGLPAAGLTLARRRRRQTELVG